MADPKLTIRIGAELSEIRRALAQVSQDITKVRAEAAKPAPLGGIEKGAAAALNAVKALAAGFAGIQGFQTFARIADQSNTLVARIKLATKSQEEFTAAYEGTFEVAQRTRTSLESTVSLYARLERSTRELGVSQTKLLALTETINQAAQISGGGPGAEAALFQLSQGLASGTLRGEELNSVLEQAPRLAEALATGLKRPIGELREFAKQGKLTSAEIVKALTDQAATIEAEYAKMPATISGAFTQLSNASIKFIGEADRAAGASQEIAGAIKLVADNLETVAAVVLTVVKVWAGYYLIIKAGPALYRAATAAADAYAAALARVAAATTVAGATSARVFAAMRIGAGLLFAAFAGWQIGSLLREQFLEVELFGIAMVNGLLKAWERLKQGTAIIWEGILALIKGAINIAAETIAGLIERSAGVAEVFGGKGVAQSMRDYADSLKPATDATTELLDAIDAINTTADENIAKIDELTGEMADYAIEARAAANAKPPKKVAEDESGKGTEGIGAGAANAAELVRDAIARALRELDRLYAEAEIDARAYFATKANLELAAIDSALETAQAELKAATTAQQQEEILTRIIKLQRDRAEVATQSARDQAAAEKDLADELAQVQARILEAQGQAGDARIAELQREFSDLRKRLEAEGDAAGVALVDRLINLEVAKTRLEQLESLIQEGLSNLRSIEGTISAQVDAGLLTGLEGERQIKAAREASVAQLETYRQTLVDLYAVAQDPAVLQAIQQLDGELARILASQRQIYNEVKEAGVNALAGAFSDLITGAATVEEAFRGMGRAFAQALADIASQELAKRAVDAIAGLFGGGKAANPVGNVAAATAAGAAQAAALTPAAVALGTAGTTVIAGATATLTAAGALQAAASTLLLANSIGAGAGVAHSGAIVGRGFPAYRQVPSWVFGGAPRYHSGGLAGLKPGEVPAILQTGEEVLTRDDPRNAVNGGGQGSEQSAGVRIINVMDPNMVSEALSSASGEKAIMNVITRNSRGISQALRG